MITANIGKYSTFKYHSIDSALGQAVDGTVLMDSDSGGVVTLNPAITQDEWEAGLGAPISVYFASGYTNVTAGNHFLCLSGYQTIAPADICVFGFTSLTLVNCGDLGAATTPPIGQTAATVAQIQALLQNFVQFGPNPAGKSVTLTSPNGLATLTLSVDDNGQLIQST